MNNLRGEKILLVNFDLSKQAIIDFFDKIFCYYA